MVVWPTNKSVIHASYARHSSNIHPTPTKKKKMLDILLDSAVIWRERGFKRVLFVSHSLASGLQTTTNAFPGDIRVVR